MSSRPGLRSRRALGLLLLLAVAGLLLQGASVPHTHPAATPGLFNQDHDLVLLATVHGAAVLAAAVPVPRVVVLVAAIVPPAPGRPAPATLSTCDCRAPPHA